MAHNFMLVFKENPIFKEDPQPTEPLARIALRSWTKDKDGLIFIASLCKGEYELEYEVNQLKAELDEILRLGREKFKNHNAKKSKRSGKATP